MGDHGQPIRQLRRDVTAIRLDMGTLLAGQGLPPATSEQIHAEMDDQ
ncbi:MAG: hypothetical protein ACT4RN_19535 [Pseudonocardia sp.]